MIFFPYSGTYKTEKPIEYKNFLEYLESIGLAQERILGK